MVYTEYDTWHNGLLVGVMTGSIIGVPVLLLLSWIDDRAARSHATAEEDEIAGRCETCGNLTREYCAHRVEVPEVGREVLVCPFGHSALGEDPFGGTEQEREKAIRAIKTPMWMKRLS